MGIIISNIGKIIRVDYGTHSKDFLKTGCEIAREGDFVLIKDNYFWAKLLYSDIDSPVFSSSIDLEIYLTYCLSDMFISKSRNGSVIATSPGDHTVTFQTPFIVGTNYIAEVEAYNSKGTVNCTAKINDVTSFSVYVPQPCSTTNPTTIIYSCTIINDIGVLT